MPPLPADDDASAARQRDPAGYKAQVLEAMAGHCRVVEMQKRGAVAFDMATTCAPWPGWAAVPMPLPILAFPAFIRDEVCTGAGRFAG